MNIKQISKKIYDTNVKNGFWDEQPRNFGEMLMLVTSELGEALEAHRINGLLGTLDEREKRFLIDRTDDEAFKSQFKQEVKDTVQDELADAVIRLFDMCEGLGIDLEWHIEAKMRYNSLRPHKHGKKY